MQFIKKGIISH